MGQNNPIETLYVRVEGDIRKLLKDVSEGVVLAEDELTTLTFEPKQFVEGIVAAASSLRERFGEALATVGERVQEARENFSGFFERLTAGFQQTSEATTTASISQQRYNQVLAEGSQQGATLMQELSALVVRLSEASGEPFINIIDGLVQAKQVTADQGEAIAKNLGIATEAGAGFAGMLGKVLTAAALAGIALGALKRIIKGFVDELKDAVAVSIEYQTSLVRLEVAVRAAQRASGEMVGSISGWKSTLEELRETYQGLSEVDLQGAAARMILVTREMKFNEEQAKRTLEAAIQLSVIYGVDLKRATSLITQGLTGISRGLRLYGVQLSRTILNEEARAQGLRRTWEELNTAERASVALEVITRQLSGTTEDLDVIYETLGGRIQAAEARIKDAKKEIGSLTAGFKVLGVEVKARAIEALASLILTLERLVAVGAGTLAFLEVYPEMIQSGASNQEAMNAALDAYAEKLKEVSGFFGLFRDELEDIEELGGIWETLAGQLQTESDEMLANLTELALEYGERFADLEADLAARIDAAHRKLRDKLVDLDKEGYQKRLDALRDFHDKLSDLILAYNRKREDIERRVAEKLAKVRDDLSERRAAIMAALHLKLLRLEEDYRIASRRSHERFVEDLQDAVANRDAWAAVRLIKRQRREQRELREDYEVRRRRAIEDAAAALAALTSNLEAQRQAIMRERDREIADLDIWLARRREDAGIDYERRLEDIRLWLERKQRELEFAHQAELEELQRHHTARQIELAAALADEENITEEGAQAIFDQLDRVFGLGGTIEQMMEAFRQRLATRIEIQMQVSQIDLGGGLPQPAPWLPTLPLHPWDPDVQPPASPISPDVQTLQSSAVTNFVNQRTETQLGVLEIRIEANEYFSADFEEMVGDQIAQFVGNVIVRPGRV